MKKNLSESIIKNLNEGTNDSIKKYRRSEFNKITLKDGNYKLKIISTTGETKWLDITEKEFAKIERLLTV